MKIAVEGCAHGELETIYSALENIQGRDNIKIDLLLCCGDFQAVRNEADLACMAVPAKYKSMCSFYKYYNGEKRAPILTIFIGGNHEASNHLWELPFGGWVAHNIYYLGYSGVVNFGGLRIAGLSGIYKVHDYNKGHYESPPFNQNTVRSIYHVRTLDVFKLKLLKTPVDIVMSHDWPKGVYHYGNLQELYRWKGFLREEIESNTLGSFAAQQVLRALQPDFWFSAHLHCRFPAEVVHSNSGKVTNFLALDKCLPKRKYLEVIDLGEAKGPLELSYDPEWLAITKLTLPLLNTEPSHTNLPSNESVVASLRPSEEAVKQVKELFDNNLKVPKNFTRNVPLYNPAQHQKYVQVTKSTNPQTDIFCKTLKIKNPFWDTDIPEAVTSENPDEISLSDDDDDDGGASEMQSSSFSSGISLPLPKGQPTADSLPIQSINTQDEMSSENPDEICLANDEESESQSSDFPQWKPNEAKPDVNVSLPGANNGKTELEEQAENKMVPGKNLDCEPPTKIFKLVRRNQTMYTTTDDSDD